MTNYICHDIERYATYIYEIKEFAQTNLFFGKKIFSWVYFLLFHIYVNIWMTGLDGNKHVSFYKEKETKKYTHLHCKPWYH